MLMWSVHVISAARYIEYNLSVYRENGESWSAEQSDTESKSVCNDQSKRV